MKDADEIYKPQIKQNVLVDGVAAETVASGEIGTMIQKDFIHSSQPEFSLIANNLISLINPPVTNIDKLLVIIKKDNTAKIYAEFPIVASIRGKKDVKKEDLITVEEIADIDTIEFRDLEHEINIEETDKVVFLFRAGWRFGLYFNFTKSLDMPTLKKELGYYYKRLLYYDLYSFIENDNNFDTLVKDGWFPFIRLIGKNFDKIMQYYKEGKKNNFQIDELIAEYTKEKIESFTQYWWRKELFKDKKDIIEAGIWCFLQNNKCGFIACLSTLYPQIEGIMGTDYFKANGRNLKHEELLEYIKHKAEKKFNTVSSTGFPSKFYEYLKRTLFENFDITSGKLDLSRHTVSHGFASAEDFNKAKALQAILILDQIYFYL